jgi:hypothetical protein
MTASNQGSEKIDEDTVLAPLQQQFAIQPPAELDRRVKQFYRDNLAQQPASAVMPPESNAWRQRIVACWQLFQQAPAVAGSLVAASLLLGICSALIVPMLWQTEQAVLLPVNTSMVLRNGQSTVGSNAQLSAEQWLEVIAELLVQQRVEEAHLQLQAFRQHYPDLGTIKP